MRIWLLHIGEELPMDGRTRSARYSLLARALEREGHDALRWAPTFSHVTKRHRMMHDARVALSDHYAIQLVYSPGYRRNVSLSRLNTYRVLGRRFNRLAEQEVRPDVIVAAIPSLEWADAAVDYGRMHGVPVAVDVRDLWPDVLLNALPQKLRRFGRPLLVPYRRMARRACAGATSLVGVSQSYLDWAIKQAARPPRDTDVVMPIGYEPEPATTEALQSEIVRVRGLGVDPSRPICFFAGSFERSYDLETVIEAARLLDKTGSNAQFVLCGDGTKMAALRRQAARLRNVVFLGWIDVVRLQAVASVSSIGLCAYAVDGLQSLPNKPFEYMAANLPIVSSLRGELADLLGRHENGLTYRAGDPRDLAGCLERLLENPGSRRAMGDKSYQLWSRQYRSEHIYSRFAAHVTGLKGTFRKAA
jgi:glycosyltransferase involved in cell wall biosynthesis